MPYGKVDELPEGVKDHMPASAAHIWMGAFNSAHEQGKDEAACAQIAWGAVKNAGWHKGSDGMWSKQNRAAQAVSQIKLAFPDLQLDADPEKAVIQLKEMFAKNGDFDAEVFSVGKWNGDDYTLDDLHDMVKNFQLLGAEIKPPVKLGHADDGLNQAVTDGQPAYGWVKALKVVGNKLVATFSDVPELLKKAIKSNRYKRVSSEIYWNLKKGKQVFKRVLGAVAFLGADSPAVTNLADLAALMSQSTDPESGSFERRAVYSFKTEDGEHLNQEERRTDVPLTEEEIKKLQEDNVRLGAALDASSKAQLDMRKNRAGEKMRTYCEAQVKAGTMMPSTRDAIMRGIKDGKFAYSDEGEGSFAVPFEMFRTVFDIRRAGPAPRVNFGEQRGRTNIEDTDEIDETSDDLDGSGSHDYTAGTGGNPGLIVDREVKKYCTKNKVDYSAGLKAVLQENPKLARAYVEATPIVKHESHAAASADVDSEE